MQRKILIIGCSGAGKAALAMELGSILGIAVHHLDSYFWKEGWKPTEREEWLSRVKLILEEEAWIVDGNYYSTLELRLKECCTVIFLDFPSLICLYGLISRRIKFHRRNRPDMAEGCPERLDWKFIKWTARYRRRNAPKIRAALQAHKEKEIVILKSRKETRQFLKELRISRGSRNETGNNSA
ncbi:hypothetical protein [Peribacillus kribbensis]|uniref:hypothetical protein n=1 Tax=Peribacillus kribbensis TaxID=356658 RepID=UPI0003FAAB1A|nr:hypothetical protein [Peribacillus kribbensis]